MKNKILCCMLLFVCIGIVKAYAYDVVRQKPYYKTHNYYYERVLPANLYALEKYSMRHTYSGEKTENRLERLEKLAFGAPQTGTVQSRYQNVEAAILSKPQYNNHKKNLIRNFTSYFSGQPTGLTPPIVQYNNPYLMPAGNTPYEFNKRRYEQFSNGIFGNGYNFTDSGYGRSSSVRILE